MSLQPNGATSTIERQDRHEYATSMFFNDAYKTVPKDKKKLFSITKMREIRDQWGKDFSREGFKLADFDRLSELLPEDEAFEQARTQLRDTNYVKETIKKAGVAYGKYMARGLFPLSVLDPQLRTLAGVAGLTKMVAYAKDKSVRELNPGEDQTIYSRTGEVLHEAETKPTVTDSSDLDIADGDEVVMRGWTSKGDAEGLDGILGAYFSSTDQKLLAKRFDADGGAPFTRNDVASLYTSQAMLKYLRSNGMEFSVKDLQETDKIELKLEHERMDLRLFDKETQYIGRVYDTYGEYYLTTRKNQHQADEMEWTTSDALATLEVMSGKRKGSFVKTYSNANSQILNVEGFDGNKIIMGSMNADRYNVFMYQDEDEAKQFIEDSIQGARDYFDAEFKADAIANALGDDGTLEELYSKDDVIREKQEGFVNDVAMMSDLVNMGMDDVIKQSLRAVDPNDVDVSRLSNDRAEMGRYAHELIADEMVGSYETGFNPSFVVDHAPENEERRHTRQAILGALRKTDYDLDKLKGNEFGTQNIKDNLIKFDPETAKGIDDIDDPFLKKAMLRVQDNLTGMGVIGENGDGLPSVQIDDKGVMEWQGHRRMSGNKPRNGQAPKGRLYTKGKLYQDTLLKGEIGQIFSPNEKGIIKTNFGSGENYGVVPGYTGYFKFDGEYGDNRMDNFRVKGFEQFLNEKLDSTVRHQVLRPMKNSWDNIPNALDASGLNGLYHGDVYGRRIDLDFVENSNLKPEVTDAILQTLRNRVRFDNQYSDHATTSAETINGWDTQHKDQGAFSYWKSVGEKNMRILHDDMANIADLTMTGTGKTQGLVWYLVDGAKVNEDGSVDRAPGIPQLDGTIKPDQTALKKLDYFDFEKYNAWDRVQMSANQLMTATYVDENVGTALMSFGGWTFDDSYVVSQDFADRNMVVGSHVNPEAREAFMNTLMAQANGESYDSKYTWSDDVLDKGLDLYGKMTDVMDGADLSELEHLSEAEQMARLKDTPAGDAYETLESFIQEQSKLRPLKRGDKVSDFGGNKGTIGIIIDRNMPLDEAKKQDLEREVAIFNANPELDVVGAPYSMLSRHNAGVVKELMDGDVKDIKDPITGETYKGAMGHLNMIVTDLTVDEKTHAYSEADVAEGKGRKISGQLAWALQSKGSTALFDEIYGYNVGPWSTFREYLITTGLDMEEDGTLRQGYQPHDATEIRHQIKPDDYETSADFLNDISDKGGFLEMPFPVEFETGAKTTQLPVLSSALRQNTELIDGRMRRSDFNNHYAKIFDAVKDYQERDDLVDIDFENDEDKAKNEEGKARSMQKAQRAFTDLQTEIIDRQFDGGYNGKHSFIRDKIMGRRMKNTATGVAVVDSRLEIGEVAMDSEMMSALSAKEGDTVMMWRDPSWRDGALRAAKVVHDESIHGIGINPISDKSHDGDFDGDTYGLYKPQSKEAIKEAEDLFGHQNNMIDLGSGKGDLYFQSGMDLATAEHKATESGDTSMTELYDSVQKNATSDKPQIRRKALKDLTRYSHLAFRTYGFGGDYVNLTNDKTQHASFKAMVDKGAKGNDDKLNTYKEYFDGKKTREDAKAIQRATGIKSDDTGLAGGVSQRLVSVLRNEGIKPALELTYPVTQGTLQIKHNAQHAEVVNDVLYKDLGNLYKGKSADGKDKNLTTNQWKTQMGKVYADKLGVPHNEEYLDIIANALSKNGRVQPIDKVMDEKGSPMDQVAYGGGYDRLKQLATDRRSLIEGEQSKLFAPLEMRNGETKVLSRADTRNVEQEEATDRLIEQRLDREFGSQKSKAKVSGKDLDKKFMSPATPGPTVAEDDGSPAL